MITIIRNLLSKIIQDIDLGNSNITEEEALEIIDLLKKFTNKEVYFSKYQSYTYLGISRASFDNLIKEGKLPKGIKQQGFKELSWLKRDLDNYIKEYKNEKKSR